MLEFRVGRVYKSIMYGIVRIMRSYQFRKYTKRNQFHWFELRRSEIFIFCLDTTCNFAENEL